MNYFYIQWSVVCIKCMIGFQGIYARALQGNASAENAALYGSVVEPLAEAGLSVALQDG